MQYLLCLYDIAQADVSIELIRLITVTPIGIISLSFWQERQQGLILLCRVNL